MSIADLRRSYTRSRLEESDLESDPIAMFARWFGQAQQAELPEPNAMTLATADARGKPSARVVLLKRVDARGFVFYSNYQSRKARDMAENPQVALVFNWLGLERQVRIEGVVHKVSREESAAYFHSRPRGSQLGAWASRQSQEVASREVLEAELKTLEALYPGEIPLPDFWGGYRVTPQAVEFWQGRPNRLHDRFVYRQMWSVWRTARLSP